MAAIFFRVKVAVESLRPQDMVEISVNPDTTWEEAKLAACEAAYADPVDVGSRRLLFRGRERSPTGTLVNDGVKPGHKLMLMEGDESKRERARVAQEAQMEQIRAYRQSQFRQSADSTSQRRDGNGGGDTAVRQSQNQSPADRCRADVAACMSTVDSLEQELGELERVTETVAAGGVAASMGATCPKDTTFLHLGDRLEKALISLDGVDTAGEDELRALRKGAVRRIQALIERGDAARARAEAAR